MTTTQLKNKYSKLNLNIKALESIPMAYKNNFPKIYIFTKCLQIKHEEKKVQNGVTDDGQSPPTETQDKHV